MKKLTLLFALLLIIGCDSNPSSPMVVSENTSDDGVANVTIMLSKVGAFMKRQSAKQDMVSEIQLEKLFITLRSDSNDLILDTINISGNDQIIVTKAYAGLASDQQWSVTAMTKDSLGVIIHSDAMRFNVAQGDTVDVRLDMQANYSMLRASFSPIKDSVTRLEVVIDSNAVVSKNILKQSNIGGAEYVSFDYVAVSSDTMYSDNRTIQLNAYGEYNDVEMLLYTGAISIEVISGIDSSYNIVLNWVGPEDTTATIDMAVIVGRIGTIYIDGELETIIDSTIVDTTIIDTAIVDTTITDSTIIGPTPSPFHAYFKEKFSIDSNDILQNAFTAYYFKDVADSSLVAIDTVDVPSINYSYSSFHNIGSEDFAAFYIGDLFYTTDTDVEITIDQSWSNTIIYINGVEVINASSNTTLAYTFSAGHNIVEVVYYNNWHTTNVSVKFEEALPIATQNSATALVAPYADVDIWYGGLYECSDRYSICDISLDSTNKPTVLFLASYHAADWDFTGEDLSNVIGIFVGDYSPSSRVVGVGDSIPVFNIAGYGSNYDNRYEASVVVNDLTGRTLTGFSGEYSGNSLVLENN
ncbi:MAG: hypothetical protein OCC49_17830 [Fibrobacterales bacterium]